MELLNGSQILRMVAALAFVLVLMLGLNLVMRRINGAAGVAVGQKRRLKVVESLNLDARRRAIILRRDDREHLVILGPAGETVVESGIAAIEKNDE